MTATQTIRHQNPGKTTMFKHLAILLAGAFAASSALAAEPGATTAWEAGKHYFVIDPAQPTASGDKVEVLEVFSYACSHCANFQPYAEQLKASLPEYASFDYMPAIFNAQWEPYARAYYTAQSLGVLDKTHQALFDALHRDHMPIRSVDDLASFYSQHGVERAKFLAASGSFEVESKLSRSMQIVRDAGVDGTPTLIVNGKYRTSGATAGGYAQMLELVGWLVEKEHKGAAKPAKAK